MRAFAILTAFTLFVALFAGDTQAQTKIKVLVNGQPITNYDVSQRAKLLRLIGGARGNPTQAAMDELIDETLQALEARRLGISVSDAQVDRAFGTIATQNRISLSQLNQALRARGVSASAFKRRIKAQMLWRNVVRQKTRTTGVVSDQDVIAEIRKRPDEFDTTTVRVNLTQIMLVVPAKGPNSNARKRMREAEQLRKQFTNCVDGMELVKKIPEVVVKQIGIRTSGEMQGPQAEAVLETEVGHLTKPTRRQVSIDMFAVCEREELQSTAAAEAKLRLELEQDATAMQLRRFARNLRKDAIIEYK